MWIRKDGSKSTDLWDIVDDHNRHDCAKCRKEKVAREFMMYGSKYNPALGKTCKICIDYSRKEKKLPDFSNRVVSDKLLGNC